jgi:hypothetical protein
MIPESARELLARWKVQRETDEDTMIDFISFIEDEDLTYEEYGLKDRDEEDKYYVIMRKLSDKFLMKDERSQTIIKREELRKLDKWIGK